MVISELERLNQERSESAALVLRLELERLDVCIRSIWPKVESGHLGAIDRMLKISDRRAKLLGLDAPTKVAPTDPSGGNEYGNMTPEERADRLAEMIETIRARIPADAHTGDDGDQAEPSADEIEEYRDGSDQSRFYGSNGTP